MPAQDILRQIATTDPAELAAAADELDKLPALEAAIAGLETSRDTFAAQVADLARKLEEKQLPATTNMLGAVQLDQFRRGADDWDDALDRALADIIERRRTTAVTPPLLFPTAQIDLKRGGRAWFDGLKLIYPFGHGNQQRAAESIPCSVRYSGSGALWKFTQAKIFDIGWEGIGWQGNANADFIEPSKTDVQTSRFGSSGFNLWRHVLGSPAQQFLTTASVFEGWWNTNNCYAEPYTFGGSDSAFAWTRHIVDVGGPGTASKFPKDGHLFHFAHTSHAPVTGLYLTCQGAVTGVRVSNAPTGGRLVLRDPIIEGRNPAQPCTANLLQVDSGVLLVENPVLEFVAKDTAREAGAGVVINGGDVEILRPTFDRANGRGPDVPVIYQAGGVLNVERAKRTARGGTWGDNKPVVKRVGGELTPSDGSWTAVA